MDKAMTMLYVRLVAQGKSYHEALSILDSVYQLLERIEEK